MDKKRLIATIYIKNGVLVVGKEDHTPVGAPDDIARMFNDCGIDNILLMDISDNLEGHRLSMATIKEINRILEVTAYGYGWIDSINDVRDYMFAGCEKVILNSSSPEINTLITEAGTRYGKDKLSLSLDTVDVLFKQKTAIEENFDDLFLFSKDIIEAVENMTEVPYYAFIEGDDLKEYVEAMKNEHCLGVGGYILDKLTTDIMLLKYRFRNMGIPVYIFESSLDWSEFKLDNDGLIAVVTQDYTTNEVLNYGYMDEEAFNETMSSGKMAYYNKETRQVARHGINNGHYQYVKSLSVDCHKQVLLAKISQVGCACHTGNYSCFFTEILRKDYIEKNIFKLLENKYNNISARKNHPIEGSYTARLFENGLNEILKKLQTVTTDMTLYAKDEDTDALPATIADLLYVTMVLMCEYDIRWDDITREMGER